MIPPPPPRPADLFAGAARRRAFLDYWRGMTIDDWRDLIAYAFLRRLPIKLASDFGAASAMVRGPSVYAQADANARANLARLRPELDETALEAMLALRWRCVGRTMAEVPVLERMFAKGLIQVEGTEHLEALRAGGRGALVVAMHLGNWEALAVVGRLGFSPYIIYEPRPTKAREYISQVVRRRLGITPLPAGQAGVRPAMRALKDHGVVSIFCDEEIEGVARGPLFGRQPNPHGNIDYAVRLARRTGAALVPAYVLREDGPRLRVVYQQPVEPPDAGAINAALEATVLAHTGQWFNLHERLDEPAKP